MYRSPIIIKVIKSRRLIWAGHVARIGEGSAFKIFTRNDIGNKPLRRHMRRWEGFIRMDLKEIGINTRNWIDSTQDRDYCRAHKNAELNHRIP